MEHFDLAIIGAGSGNMVVNRRFADWKVAMLQEGPYGGTCLNVGCIPTKMYVYPADLVRAGEAAAALGVETEYNAFDWPRMRDRIFGRIEANAQSAQLFREQAANITTFPGRARFVAPKQLRTGTGEVVTADQIVIATGSRVHRPTISGLDGIRSDTSDTVMRLEELPRQMLIVGGGYVAAEFAHIFSAFGTEVIQLQRSGALLQHHDRDISRTFTELAGQQWEVRLNTQLSSVRQFGDQIIGSVGEEELPCDVLLLATGRVPNSELDLATAGIETNANGTIRVDAHQRTSAAGVWALGDVANDWQLKHVANHEARVIQHNLLHPDDLISSDHRYVPSAVFTSPQIASVGRTEEQARADQGQVRVAIQEYADVAYGWAMEDTTSYAKLIGTADGQHLLGAHIIGPEASLLIQPLVQGMSLGATVEQMARGQYWPHPALSEVVENALLKLMKAKPA